MNVKPRLFSGAGLRRLLHLDGVDIALERRVMSLPVMVERRGPSCPSCGFGRMQPIPDGHPKAGLMRCNRTGCAMICEPAEPAAAPPVYTIEDAYART